MCPRCEKEDEDWKHIWTCENNKITIREAIIDALIKYEEELEKQGKEEKVIAMNKIAKKFISFLQEESEILTRRTKEWELVRGIYNENLTKITKNKLEKEIIWEMWKKSFEGIKVIWIERCEEIDQIEREKGITKHDKRKIREKKKLENNEKTKDKIKTNKKIKLDGKSFKLVTEYRMVNDMTRDNMNSRKWHTYIKM